MGNLINRGDGYFYGVARWAEEARGGLVYRIAPGQEAEELHVFPEIEDDTQPSEGGSNPSCPMVLGADGALYGATELGGAYKIGTIYRISADGVFSVVRDMRRTDKCYDIHCLVPTPEGELYGAAEGGDFSSGTLFKISSDGGFQSLYSFKSSNLPSGPWPHVEPGFVVEPRYPSHLALGDDGKLYGTTDTGGPKPASPFLFTYGVFFRYEGVGSITVLNDFNTLEESSSSITPTKDGFYITTPNHLLLAGTDGSLVVKSDLSSQSAGSDLYLGGVITQPDGIYGATYYGGANNSGLIYRLTLTGTTEILHDFSPDYHDRLRSLVNGNDGLIYGIAAFPENFIQSAPAAQSALQKPITSNGPRSFRLQPENTEANFAPLASPDSIFLSTASWNGKRKASLNVLRNDLDPDGDPVSIDSVSTPGSDDNVWIQKTDTGLRVVFATPEKDPASKQVIYQVSDGRGGRSTGHVTIKSRANGVYAGNAAKVSKSEGKPSPLQVKIRWDNTLTATFTLNDGVFTGEGVLEGDDSATVTLSAPSRTPKRLHISVKRGEARALVAKIDTETAIYTAICPQLSKD
ncbi:MAG: choice-of-anchor tandem repeat GloVer-containing protein [Luteolibacter sp.]|uniref:choice-of-anchor tandem repeat GloVer-containing protein n=1 Tax=Luteolibacter sp. TaxID=1962973 RepID=UPI003267FBBA